MTTVFSGVPAAPGIGISVVHVIQSADTALEIAALAAGEQGDPEHEWQRFLFAQGEVEAELTYMGKALSSVAGDIFAVHQLILTDPTLTDAVRSGIIIDRLSAVNATQRAIHDLSTLFSELDDEYFASRAADITDIGRRLMRHLGIDVTEHDLRDLPEGVILVARDLTPSDVAQLTAARVVGIALAESTPTAHTAILARSLGLPLVCGLGHAVLSLSSGTQAILDGLRGRLLVSPDRQELADYDTLQHTQERQRQQAYGHAHEPAVTRDGQQIAVYANANNAEDAAQVRHIGADGIGLLRTEYLFQSRSAPPTVAEQSAIYGAIGRTLAGKLLTVRALDAGGDKPVEFLPGAAEANPFLGKRGIRLLLAHPQLLRGQYQALATAARDEPLSGRVRFMLPMISTLEEVETACALIDEVHHSLFGRPRQRTEIELGVLIEVPAAALIARHLAPLVDFFSIGTNDLAQYVLAGDRTNSQIAELADPLHPAVLMLIRHVCLAAQEHALPVSLCGEMAGDVSVTPLLCGLGVTEFSAPLPAVPMVKQVIRAWSSTECRALAEAALRCGSVGQVRALLAETQKAGSA